jgi:hypothetical protein
VSSGASIWDQSHVEDKRSPLVVIQESVIAVTGRLLRESKRGRKRHEGVVYWAGLDLGSDVLVTTCIAPSATTTPGSFHISAEANARVITVLNDLRLVLLAQVHSHPGAWIQHSGGDDSGAFMPFENLLSIVVPDYGHEDPWPLTNCGVHLFAGGEFRRLSNREIEEKFRIFPTSCDLRKT